MENVNEVVATSTTPVAKRVVISLSGGLDSTMLTMHYLSKGYEVFGVSFKYGQRHSVELKKVQKNVKFLQKLGLPITHQIVDLTSAFALSQSSLHKNSKTHIPHDRYDSENQKSTVISNRNVTFSSIIYGMALDLSKINNSHITISLGVHANDNSIYPDCRPESVQMARDLFKISNWGSELVSYETPFVNVNKAAVLKFGIDAMKLLGFSKSQINKILSNTHSCYDVNEQGESCGRCGTCQERRAAFASNNIKDPIKYAEPEENLPPIEMI